MALDLNIERILIEEPREDDFDKVIHLLDKAIPNWRKQILYQWLVPQTLQKNPEMDPNLIYDLVDFTETETSLGYKIFISGEKFLFRTPYDIVVTNMEPPQELPRYDSSRPTIKLRLDDLTRLR